MKNVVRKKKEDKKYKSPYCSCNIDREHDGDIYALPTQGKNKNLFKIKYDNNLKHCVFIVVGSTTPYINVNQVGNDRSQRGYLPDGSRREQSSVRPTNVKCINSKDPNRIGKTLKENIDTYNELVKKTKESVDKKKELDNRLEGFRKSAKENSTIGPYMSATPTQMRLFEEPIEVPDFSVKEKPKKNDISSLIDKGLNYLVANAFDGSWDCGHTRDISMTSLMEAILEKPRSLFSENEKTLQRTIRNRLKTDNRFNVRLVINRWTSKENNYISFVREVV